MDQEDPLATQFSGQFSGPDAPLSTPMPPPVPHEPAGTRFLKWTVIGPHGLRVGWTVVIFLVLTVLFAMALGAGASAFIHSILHT
jgi:hypothetical protein